MSAFVRKCPYPRPSFGSLFERRRLLSLLVHSVSCRMSAGEHRPGVGNDNLSYAGRERDMNGPVDKRRSASQPPRSSPARLAWRRGAYGVDAPYVPLMFAGFGALGLVLGLGALLLFQSLLWAIVGFVYAAF